MMMVYNAKETAKFVRAKLKKDFPSTKFSVISNTQSVYVRWFLGPTEKQVKESVDEFGSLCLKEMADSPELNCDGEVAFNCYPPSLFRSTGMISRPEFDDEEDEEDW